MADVVTCKSFTDYLRRRAEYLDYDIIRDITPLDGWVGHVSTGAFPAGQGVEHTFDRLNRVYPNLCACWEDIQVGNCTGTPCDPNETEIGFGFTRDSYKLQTKSFRTQLFCFDQMMSALAVRETFQGILENLKEASNIITSDRLKFEAFRIAGTKLLARAASGDLTPITTATWSADCQTLSINGGDAATDHPSSVLTMEMLLRQVQPLIMEGYFGKNPTGVPMFELVTDMETAWDLKVANHGGAQFPNDSFRWMSPSQISEYYKYGISDAVGNFLMRIDPYPMRFQVNGNTLVRVYPFENEAASAVSPSGPNGIKGALSTKYVNAPVQISFIWHRQAMKSLVRTTEQINSMMPFASRDFAGKWQFVMDNLGADSNGCVIDNSRRNKGKFIADFAFATKAERPEWAVAIVHRRFQPCVADVAPCAAAPGYVAINCSSANDPCETCFDLVTAGVNGWEIAANAATCNGFAVVHDAAAALANVAAVLAWLQANLAELGTWSLGTGNQVCLTNSVCETVTIPFTADN